MPTFEDLQKCFTEGHVKLIFPGGEKTDSFTGKPSESITPISEWGTEYSKVLLRQQFCTRCHLVYVIINPELLEKEK